MNTETLTPNYSALAVMTIRAALEKAKKSERADMVSVLAGLVELVGKDPKSFEAVSEFLEREANR